jgi:hypothetical protein
VDVTVVPDTSSGLIISVDPVVPVEPDISVDPVNDPPPPSPTTFLTGVTFL